MKNRSNFYGPTCSIHKRYRAKRKPRSTKKFPGGCSRCWEIYHERHGVAPKVDVPKVDFGDGIWV